MTSIINLAYEVISGEFSRAKYGEFDVIMITEGEYAGYINATKLCPSGKKELKHWSETQKSKEFIRYATDTRRSVGYTTDPIYKYRKGDPILWGTYIHPDLTPHVAMWISDEFGYRVSKIVNDFLQQEHRKTIEKKNIEIGELKQMIQEMMKRNKTRS